MATRRVRRTIRRSTGGINVAADIDAVIATGDGDGTTSVASSSQHSVVTQTQQRRTASAAAHDRTRGES
jgi:hypothetical protein